MASDKKYLEYIMEGLADKGDISYRAMMGEYIIYCKGKVVGGIYDNRLLVKNVKSAKKIMPDAVAEIPYPGGSLMLLVDNVDDKLFLEDLFMAVSDDVPDRKKRQKSN